MTPQQFSIHSKQQERIAHATQALAINLASMVGMLATSVLLAGSPIARMAAFIALVFIVIATTCGMLIHTRRLSREIMELRK